MLRFLKSLSPRKKLKINTLLDNQLFLHFVLTNLLERNEMLHQNLQVKGELAEKLLLYDKIVIPTADFAIIPILIDWFGDKLFQEILERNVFSFIRCKGWPGYTGWGRGLIKFEIRKKENTKVSKW